MPSIPTDHGHLALPFGRFYGREDIRRSAPGVELSLLRVDPHRVVERHSHEEAHFVLVLDGLYVSSAEGAPPVSAGVQLIFNPAGTTHRDRFEARGRVYDGRFLTISLTADTMREAAERATMPERALVIDSREVMALAVRLSRVCAQDGGDAPLTRHSLVLELLAQVAGVCRAAQGTAPAWLRVARECLDDSLGGTTSIAEVARAAGVHPVHLARVFRQYLGMSPAAYLRKRRVEQARALVEHSTRSLGEIAVGCGFSHQSHFCNVFRETYGVTAAEVRRRGVGGCQLSPPHRPVGVRR